MDLNGDALQESLGRDTEVFMFETPEEVKQKEPKGFWIGIIVVVIIVMTGTLFYIKYRGGAQKVLRATMNKDRTGTTAVWLVTIENKSPVYSYSKIQYETSYVGADNNAILINKGTIPASIGPGEHKNSEINDALYPAGTAWYKLKITGATPAAQ